MLFQDKAVNHSTCVKEPLNNVVRDPLGACDTVVMKVNDEVVTTASVSILYFI